MRYSENLYNFCQKNNLKLILYNPITHKFYDSNKSELPSIFSFSNFSNLIGKNSEIYKYHKPDNCLLGKKRKINSRDFI